MIKAFHIPKSILILIVLLSIVGVLEYLPAVKHAREAFPENFAGLSCRDILNSRPWYGQINPWFWFWLISTPVIVFSLKPDTSKWARAFRTLIAIGLGYIVVNLGTHAAMEIRNAPFHGEGITHVNGVMVSSEIDAKKFECFDSADGAKFVFALFFGWVYALIYTGWWEAMWFFYHKKFTNLIGKDFKQDWLSKIVMWLSIVATVFGGIGLAVLLY